MNWVALIGKKIISTTISETQYIAPPILKIFYGSTIGLIKLLIMNDVVYWPLAQFLCACKKIEIE